MKSLILLPIILLFNSQLNAQTFNLLKDYIPGNSILYQFERNATPAGFFQDTSSIIGIFDGTYRTYVDSITLNGIDSINTYHLRIHKVGTEIVQNVNRIISSWNIDTVYDSFIKEFINSDHRSGENRIVGWLFPDTVNQSPRCTEDSTIFYTYPYYYRFYNFPSVDTFNIRGDTLLLTNLTTDCFDFGYTMQFRITNEEGLIKRINGLFNYFDWSYTDVYVKDEVSGIDDQNRIPNQLRLYQNYPNPFNPFTTIKYSVPTTSNISLVVYDILGREIQTLVNGEMIAGNYEVLFNGTNFPSGVYLYVLKSSKFIETKKFVLIK